VSRTPRLSPRLRRRHATGGQSLAEFALAMPVFVLLLLGTIDLGRGVYQLNAVSQAAREIARTTSVYPGAPLGTSGETAATISAQRAVTPGLIVNSYTCVDIANTSVVGNCRPGNWVRVQATSRFQPVLPLLLPLGPINLTSSSSAEIE
jgi:Flp pilus assembly protein TadG